MFFLCSLEQSCNATRQCLVEKESTVSNLSQQMTLTQNKLHEAEQLLNSYREDESSDRLKAELER